MNRKVVLIALFFALIAGILIIRNSETLDCNKIDNRFSISDINIRDVCTSISEKMKQENKASCEEFESDYIAMSNCYVAFAVSNKDESVCDKEANNSDMRFNFLDNECYRAVAELKQNESICEKIHNDITQKVSCIFNIAVLKNDPNICMNIENDVQSFINISKDHTNFEDYVFNKDICVAAVKRDRTLCEKVKALTSEYYTDLDARNSCYDVVSRY